MVKLRERTTFAEMGLGGGDLLESDTCIACQHRCALGQGRTGICGVRMIESGRLRCIRNYISHARTDPVERKPIFHFMPGTQVYSIGTVGCNFRCEFCQNHEISMEYVHYPITYAPPAMVVRMARSRAAAGIAFTFNEPTVSLEYCRDVSRLARRKGLYTVFVTNGYLTREAIDYINPHIDAYIVGIKTFDKDFYRRSCGADLSKLEMSLTYLSKVADNLEFSYLVRNDDNNIEKFLGFYRSLDRQVPLHLGKLFPEHLSTETETTTEKLLECYRIAKEHGLDYVYISDLYGSSYENTYCPTCGALVIGREGSIGEPSISLHCAVYQMVSNRLKDGNRCPSCGRDINIRTSHG